MVKQYSCTYHSSTFFYHSSLIRYIAIYILYTLPGKDYKVRRMKFVDSVSSRMTQTLFEANSISKEEVSIYKYCLSYFLESLIYCTYILFLALVSGQVLNGFLIILIFLPLKIFAGGYHAKTHKTNVTFFPMGSWCAFFLGFLICTLPLQPVGQFCILYVVFLWYVLPLLIRQTKGWKGIRGSH